MAKPKNSYEELARKADARLQKVRDRGQQLQLLPDEAGVTPDDAAKGNVGRPKGAKNKGSSELRKWLAAQGYVMPEDQLAKMAGLDSADPVIVQAMARVEEVMTWAFQDATVEGKAREPSPEQRISLLMQFVAIMERAAAALLPYGTPKATPDVNVNQNVNVIVPMAPSQPVDRAAQARDVTPENAARMVPADVRAKNEQEQPLSESETENSDEEIRTEGTSN